MGALFVMGFSSPTRPRAAVRAPLQGLVVLLTCLVTAACAGEASNAPEVEFTIPSGASFDQVVDTLVQREIVGFGSGFKLFARIRGDDHGVRSGQYRVARDIRWVPLLDQLVTGRVVTVPMTIPEGYTLAQIAPRIAELTELPIEDVAARISDPNAAGDFDLPGPTLEGYLFPDTYRFAPGVSLDSVLEAMVERYRGFWTRGRRSRARQLGFSEREVTTLASIIQGEARRVEEMPIISGVFHNRLRIGYLLQADPTVQYALGGRRERLLFSDIESVAEHPYNTYTQPGLPPGPIGAPGEAALNAALDPADVEFLYFVARPDGSHIFTESLRQHNQARIDARREWDQLERAAGEGA